MTTQRNNLSMKPIHKKKSTKVPRPMNCFLAYRLAKQGEIVAQCPGANHRDISKIIAKWWKEATEEEKAPFRDQANKAKEEHAKKYPGYKYAPQKKTNRTTRKYTMRPKDKFTSKLASNNRMMELLFHDRTTLDYLNQYNEDRHFQSTHHDNKVLQLSSCITPYLIVEPVSPPIVYSDDLLWASPLSHTSASLYGSTTTYSPHMYSLNPSPYSDTMSNFILNETTPDCISLSTPQPTDFNMCYSPSDYHSECAFDEMHSVPLAIDGPLKSNDELAHSQSCIDPRFLCAPGMSDVCNSVYYSADILSHW
ncbi:hypothetical protein BDF14DRAFT_1883599 [Spinellus fusiger]|nr:hypothetical protein BDF14DRAFT_1883599 [Spinellus fusiger]